jgi:Ca-activated chloride channel family protein
MRTLVLESPRWLWLLAAVPVVVGTALLSVAELSAFRRVIQGALRVLFVSLIALVMAGPTLRRQETAISAVVLADGSDSLTDAQLAEESALVAALQAAARRHTPAASVRVVRFAAEPEEVQPPFSLRAPRAGDTDLGLALGLGLGLLDPGRVPRLLLLSDGQPTKGDASAAGARAAVRGARLFFRQPGGAAAHDVAVLDLGAPEEIRPHATFDLEIRLVATHAGTAQLELERDGQPQDSAREIAFSPGVTTVRWPTRVEHPTPSLFRAHLLHATDDGRPENDAGLLAVAPQTKPRVLVLDGHGPASAPLVRALGAEGFEVATRPPRLLGAELVSHDLLVLADVARGALTAGQQEAIDRYLHDGGGLLVAGGPDSFGSGGYLGTRLANLLPVRQDPTDERTEATLALALVIDRSGSMSGPKMDLTKEAARGTAQMLAPEDLISVIVFDSQSHAVVRLQAASNRQRILNDIAQIRASGGTNILPGLREAFDELLPARARKKHVIVLSDGQSPYEGIPELIDDAAAAHITVSAVGVGEGADQTLLQMIANRGGGRFYHTRDPASIPQIFTRETAEVSRSSIIEAPTRLRAGKRAEMLAGLSLEAAPALRGYSRTRARKEAEVLVATAQGDPLLARWQVGLGQAAAWTSDVGGRWAADLARWPSFAKLWGQIARGTMRRGAAHQFPLQLRLTGDRVQARVDARGADDEPLSGLSGAIEVTEIAETGERTERQVPIDEATPGVYQAEWAVHGPGALLVMARLGRDGAPIAEARGRLSLPLARELTPAIPGDAHSGRALLASLAQRTGGGEARLVEEVLDPGPDRVDTRRPLRTPLLILTILVFLADVALRRVRLRRS